MSRSFFNVYNYFLYSAEGKCYIERKLFNKEAHACHWIVRP